MKQKAILIVVLSMFLLMGCASKKQETTVETATPVRVASIAKGELVQSIEFNGDIAAEVEVKVFSKIPNNRIEKFHVEEGDYIEKGQSIATIKAPAVTHGLEQARASLAAVKAQLENVKMEYERAERLYNENAMSKQQYDQVKTQYESTQAQLEQIQAAVRTAESSYEDASVEAPISGIIGVRYYEAGDMINMTQPLVSIVQMKKVKITFDATEEDLGKLSVGQKAEITVKSYPDTTFVGKVVKISPVLDPLTRMADVEVLINNPDYLLKPGMFGRLKVITGILSDVIVVPRYATIENTTLERKEGKDVVVKNYYVFVAADSVAQQRKLDIEYVNHVNIAVKGGVQVGEGLIVQGQKNLKNGAKITYGKEGGDL